MHLDAVVTGRGEVLPRLLRELGDALDRVHLVRELRQHRGLVPGAGAHVQHFLAPREPERLRDAGDHVRLRDRLPVADRQRRVGVGTVPFALGDEELPRHALHRGEDPLVDDVAPAQLLLDHSTACVRLSAHGRRRNGRAPAASRRQSARVVRRLGDVVADMNAQRDLESVLDRIAASLRELTSADAGGFVLIEDDSLRLVSTAGLPARLRGKTATLASDSFSTLLATGLTAVMGLQVFVIVGGVTRVIPLTGVTLPFVSYGGSSILANFVMLALLLIVSNAARTGPAERGGVV